MRPTICQTPIALVQSGSVIDHFAGVDERLRLRGLTATRYLSPQTPPVFDERTRVVVVADLESFLCLRALREARRVGARTILLMDGIVEHRNTFCNPRNDKGFLRPAPVDVIAAAGEADRSRLESLGNKQVSCTGLPRIASSIPKPLPAPVGPSRLLIATARRPAFNDIEQDRLVAALGAIREEVSNRGDVQPIWRLSTDLADAVGVVSADDSLVETLRCSRAVLTTPSTLLIEAMRAGRPTALIHPFDTPLWQRAVWTWGRADEAGPDHLTQVLDELLAPSRGQLQQAARILAQLHHPGDPAESLAELIADGCARCDRSLARATSAVPDRTRLPARISKRSGRRRVISCIFCESSAVGGVSVWSNRLSRSLAAQSDGAIEGRTLVITTHRHLMESLGATFDPDLTSLCVIDPTADHVVNLDQVAASIERLCPDIILPNYIDLVYAAATQVRSATGARMIAVAHTDDAYYRRLMSFYDGWDAAVGVSDACMNWVKRIAGDRPCRKITYGVPIATSAPNRSEGGALRIAYIGRMAQRQKRIFDLLTVIEELEYRGCAYEFHLVGEGPDLNAWRRELRRLDVRSGRILVHGEKSAAWIGSLLARLDVSVLVSESEGASLSMLEAMGAGVAPVVTDVSSGAREWIEDGVNGAVVPVGEPDLMASRLAELALDREQLASLGRCAWERVREARISIDRMAAEYISLFEEILNKPLRKRTPADTGVRLIETWRWQKGWCDDPTGAQRIVRRMLDRLGCPESDERAIAPHLLECDEVIRVSEQFGAPDHIVHRTNDKFEGHCAPQPFTVWRVNQALKQLIAKGGRRIAIYGIGQHTRRASVVLESIPTEVFVGFIDDRPPESGRFLGRPVVPLDRAMKVLKPDAIVISSDAYETEMYGRCKRLESRGVRVVTLYDKSRSEVVEEPAAAQGCVSRAVEVEP